jgi:hypothetical protein
MRILVAVGGSFAERRKNPKYPEGFEIEVYPKDSFMERR